MDEGRSTRRFPRRIGTQIRCSPSNLKAVVAMLSLIGRRVPTGRRRYEQVTRLSIETSRVNMMTKAVSGGECVQCDICAVSRLSAYLLYNLRFHCGEVSVRTNHCGSGLAAKLWR